MICEHKVPAAECEGLLWTTDISFETNFDSTPAQNGQTRPLLFMSNELSRFELEHVNVPKPDDH